MVGDVYLHIIYLVCRDAAVYATTMGEPSSGGRTKCHNKQVKTQIVATQLFGIFQMLLHSEVSLSDGCVFLSSSRT